MVEGPWGPDDLVAPKRAGYLKAMKANCRGPLAGPRQPVMPGSMKGYADDPRSTIPVSPYLVPIWSPRWSIDGAKVKRQAKGTRTHEGKTASGSARDTLSASQLRRKAQARSLTADAAGRRSRREPRFVGGTSGPAPPPRAQRRPRARPPEPGPGRWADPGPGPSATRFGLPPSQ